MNGISPALLLGEHDNSFSRTPLLGSSTAILEEIFTYISPFKINLVRICVEICTTGNFWSLAFAPHVYVGGKG